MRGKLPFVDEDPENYNESQKKVAKFFDNIIEFFVLDEDEQENDTKDKSCTEQAESTEQEESTEPQKSENMSNIAILLMSIGAALFTVFGLCGMLALITACVWSDAGNYSRGIMLKGNAVFAAIVFFIAFAVLINPNPESNAASAPTMQAIPISPNIMAPIMIPMIPPIISRIPISFMICL